MARISDMKRKLSAQEFNLGGQITRRAFAALLFLLLLAPPSAFFVAQAQSPAQKSESTLTKQQALDSLNGFLADSIHPAEMNQVKGISKANFETWLKQPGHSRATQTAIRKELQPVLSAQRFEAVVLRGVKLKETDKTTNVLLIGVPLTLRKKLNRDVYIIQENLMVETREMVEWCKYDSCYQGTCYHKTTMKVEGQPCPVSNCDACPTSEGGDGGNGGLKILRAISIF